MRVRGDGDGTTATTIVVVVWSHTGPPCDTGPTLHWEEQRHDPHDTRPTPSLVAMYFAQRKAKRCAPSSSSSGARAAVVLGSDEDAADTTHTAFKKAMKMSETGDL